MNIIDIHSHILPYFDDGSKSIEDSIEIARLSVADGVTVLFATPHVASHKELQQARIISEKTDILQSILEEHEIHLQLATGAEVYPSSSILKWLDEGYPLTMGPSSRYILIDSPLAQIPIGLHDLIFDLQANQYKPIIAHPERVEPIQKNPQIMEELVNKGVLFQINASSIMGRQGDDAVTTAMVFLRHKWAHFIASDTHSPRHRRPMIAPAIIKMAEIMDTDDIRDLVELNGKRILENKPIPTNPAVYTPAKSKSFFSNLISGFRRN
ncbi:MAG: tyrosine-protein phosphatase [Armatimonadota bacterium]